jgi:hypothetical protein
VRSNGVKDRWNTPTMLLMPSVSRLSSIVIALVCLAVAAPVTQDNPTSSILGTVTPPDKDEFYRAPSGFEKAPLGAILKHRPVPNPIAVNNTTPINMKAAWQILYRTQNSVGQAEATVVTVMIPHNPKFSNLVAYGYWTVCIYSTPLKRNSSLTFLLSLHHTMGIYSNMNNFVSDYGTN